MNLSKAISIRVKNLLKDKNMSQYELYKKGGIPSSTISDVVNNKKKRVSSVTVYQICSTLGLTLQEFYADKIFLDLDD